MVSAGGNITQLQPTTASAAPAPASAGTASEINAPMAGTVIDILVNPGDVVSENQTLVIIEAMKMETEIRADRAGTVQSVHVIKGDALHVNQLLVTLS